MEKHKKYTLFIIENNEAYSFMLKYKLQRHEEYRIVYFKSFEDYIESNGKPDIILLDYKLLYSCNQVILETLKVHSKSIPFILLVALSEVTSAVSIMKEGVFEYIVKEADSTRLANKLFLKITSILKKKETIKIKTKEMKMFLWLVLLILAVVIICWTVY